MKRHPAAALGSKYRWFAVLFGAMAVVFFAAGLPLAGVALGVMGAIFVWFGSVFTRNIAPANAINSAADALARGRIDEARAHLDSIEGRKLRGHMARAAGLIRARLALQEGDPRTAVAHVTAAIETRASTLTRGAEAVQRVSALGLRALAHALLGETERATADAREARAPYALPDAHARASLAEAVCAARADDRETIRRLWTADKRLMLEYLPPRERVLARALSKLARAEKKSVYREPARAADQDDPVRGWVSRFVPGAAAYVGSVKRADEATRLGPEGAPSAEAVKKVSDARKKGASANLWRRRLLVPIVTIAVTAPVVSWLFLRAPGSDAIDVDPLGTVSGSLAILLPVLVAAYVGVIVYNVRTTRGLQTRTRKAVLDMLRDGDKAEAELTTLSKHRFTFVAAESSVLLADCFERRSDFLGAIGHCDQAIGRLTVSAAMKAVAHDMLLPAAIAERAFCLAALGRASEADAELAALASFPTFSLAARAAFRVRLAQLLVRHDRGAALALARQRTIDLPLSHRDELLCDLLEATESSFLEEDEWARLDVELREDPKLAAWTEHFLPGARARLVPKARVVSDDELEQIDAGGDAGDARAVHG